VPRFLRLSAGAAPAAFAAALAATFPALAHAQSGEPDERSSPSIIVVGEQAASRAERQASATPGGADVVRHEEYADRSLVSLRDALTFSPGIYLQPRYGQEVRISIRGSGISRGYHMRGLTLLQDGVPINLADDNGDFQELDPIFFDHLEIYRGANALRFGSGTLGGAINGVTPTGTDARGLYLRADAGSFETLRGLASYGGVSGDADYWAAVAADTSDGDREHAKRHSLRFHGNLGFRLSDAVRTRFYASLNNIDQELPGALSMAGLLKDPESGNFAGHQQRNIDSIRVQNRTSVSFTGGQVELGLFLNHKSLYHPIFQVVDQVSTDRGAYARLDWSEGPLELTLGGEARFGDVDSKRYVNQEGVRGELTFAADQEAMTASLYGELRFKPTDRLSLIAGGIWSDGWRKQRQTFSGTVTDISARADFSELSPKFGLLFEPAPNLQLYANYSRSAEFPGFIELAQISSFVPVAAQTAWTAEIGTRGSAGIASWDLSLYRSDIDGELLQFTTGPDIPASTFNAGETLHQGIEAGLTLRLTEWLRLRQVYQYSDFRFEGDRQFGDNRLPVVPEHVYRAELRIGTDRLHVAPNLEWVPDGAWADYANTVRSGGYALLGLTAGAKLTDDLDLFLDARNLTYKVAVGDISAVIKATPDAIIYYPVENRVFFAGLRARF